MNWEILHIQGTDWSNRIISEIDSWNRYLTFFGITVQIFVKIRLTPLVMAQNHLYLS